MNKMLVAVFGHYDSRGGTTAMPIREATLEELARVKKKYDLDLFGIEEPEDRIKTTAYGMEARECDKQVHALLYRDGETPASEDLMYIAELHYPDDANLGGDLEELDDDGNYRRVLAESANSGEPDEDGDGDARESSLEESLERPVQLELAIVSVKFRNTWVNKLAVLDAKKDAIRDRVGIKPYPGPSYWDDPEYKAIQAEYKPLWERLMKDRRKKAIKSAKVLKNPVTCRWDDDAYGFVLMGE